MFIFLLLVTMCPLVTTPEPRARALGKLDLTLPFLHSSLGAGCRVCRYRYLGKEQPSRLRPCHQKSDQKKVHHSRGWDKALQSCSHTQ